MGYKIGVKSEREKKLKAELKRIVSKLPSLDIEKAILIGSLASGKIHKASDIDLILVKKTEKKFLERLEEMYEVLEPRVAVDIFVYTPEEFEEMKEVNPFIKKALENGKLLYER